VSEVLSAVGVALEVLRRGSGPPMLLLHGFQNVDPRAPFLEGLGRHAEIIAPSHPGSNPSRPC
jgi:pimeloyl-ACP methyl ester carboxylesterase